MARPGARAKPASEDVSYEAARPVRPALARGLGFWL